MPELTLLWQVEDDLKPQNHQMTAGGFVEASPDLASKGSFGIVVVEGGQVEASASEIAWVVEEGNSLAGATDLEREQKTSAAVHNYEGELVELAVASLDGAGLDG